MKTRKGFPKNMTIYTVGVREIHVRYFTVKAASPDEARALVDKHRERARDCETSEFSHELGSDTWSVEETS